MVATSNPDEPSFSDPKKKKLFGGFSQVHRKGLPIVKGQRACDEEPEHRSVGES